MADAKKVARGKSAIEKALEKIPADKRGTIAAALGEVEDALEVLGEDGLRQDEFSRAMNEVKVKGEATTAYKTNLDTWWQDTSKELNELRVNNALLQEQIKTGKVAEPPAGEIKTPAVDLTGYVKKEEVDKVVGARLAEAQAQVVPLVTAINKVAMQHFKNFGEILDTDALVAHCRKENLPIDRGGYESYAKEKIDAAAAKTQEDVIKAAEKRGEERARQQFGSNTPYPVGNNEPSTLDGLDKTKQGQFGVDAAVASFNKAISAQ